MNQASASHCVICWFLVSAVECALVEGRRKERTHLSPVKTRTNLLNWFYLDCPLSIGLIHLFNCGFLTLHFILGSFYSGFFNRHNKVFKLHTTGCVHNPRDVLLISAREQQSTFQLCLARFPRGTGLLWLYEIRRMGFSLTRHTKVCSRHLKTKWSRFISLLRVGGFFLMTLFYMKNVSGSCGPTPADSDVITSTLALITQSAWQIKNVKVNAELVAHLLVFIVYLPSETNFFCL